MNEQTPRDRALQKLLAIASATYDPEVAHGEADDILLDLIDDDEIRAAYNRIAKWYS